MKGKFKLLRSYLLLFGFVNVFLVTTLPFLFDDYMMWTPRNTAYELMLASIYFSLGIVMIIGSKYPDQQKSLIDFLVFFNVLHASIMLVYAQNPFHILLDVVPIAIQGILPLFFYPWGLRNYLIRSAV